LLLDSSIEPFRLAERENEKIGLLFWLALMLMEVKMHLVFIGKSKMPLCFKGKTDDELRF